MRQAGIRHDSLLEENMMFHDRKDAGERLAARLLHLKDKQPVVLALPRGGVAIGFEIARLLGAPLDIVLVRKIGVPWQPELALGAVGENGAVVLNDSVVAASGMRQDEVEALVGEGSRAVEEVVDQLRPATDPPDLGGRTVIVVDDGVATGATARAAAKIVRSRGPRDVIFATPVGAPSTCSDLRAFFDDVICLETPMSFGSVGQHYEHFDQVSIGEVRRLLGRPPA
jgi:putative phosphoribosyl transferase